MGAEPCTASQGPVCCLVVIVDCMGAEPFTASRIHSLCFKMVDTVECGYFRSCAITFTFFPPSCCLITIIFVLSSVAFLSFLAGLGIDKDSFLLVDILVGEGVEEKFSRQKLKTDTRQKTNRHGGSVLYQACFKLSTGM